MKHRFTLISTLGGLLFASLQAGAGAAPTTRIAVDFAQGGRVVSPTMHGLFFEDINYGADGGLYAELVQNRSFEHREAMYAWTPVNPGGQGTIAIATEAPLNDKNPHYIRVQTTAAAPEVGLSNSGFGGIAVKQGEKYLFSVRARGTVKGLRVRLEDEKGRVIGECPVTGLGDKWQSFEGAMTSSATTLQAHLVVTLATAGRADLDMISLFPENTYKKRRNGLRPDLVQMLAGIKPGFLRFPGGCIVEGKDLSNSYRWKETIGDVAARPENWNRWMEWQAPQYYQTYGLGFYEYFLLCEDIGAAPVPVINVGMACQYQSGETVPLSELGPYVQDALDLVEFANGPVTSTWGAKRAAMGHPAPFNLKFLGVGNEQWGEGYFERYKIFYDALKAKYPTIKIVSTSGPGVDDNWWNLAWGKFKNGTPAQVVDEHYYRPPSWFLANNTRYDNQDRNGPKVFAGEFAAHPEGRRNNLEGALAEAAFMTGLVRNADAVEMSSYAPVFAKAGSTQWTPDLIWFDNAKVYGSPSYYVQQQFGVNRPDMAYPAVLEKVADAAPTFAGKVGVGTWATQAEYKDIKVTRGDQTLFNSDFSKGVPAGAHGNWAVVDGALRQSGNENGTRAVFGDASWSDYTLSLKARKLGGAEGFLILFQLPDDDAVVWWNIGGWGNTRHGLEIPGVNLPSVPGRIENNRWYDIKVELKGLSVKCYLDGQLIQSATRAPANDLYAVAGRDIKSGEVILQVVNTSNSPSEAKLDLQGLTGAARTPVLQGRMTVLTGANVKDENSFENPTLVAPRDSAFGPVAPAFEHTFPARSLTTLRLKVDGNATPARRVLPPQ